MDFQPNFTDSKRILNHLRGEKSSPGFFFFLEIAARLEQHTKGFVVGKTARLFIGGSRKQEIQFPRTGTVSTFAPDVRDE